MIQFINILTAGEATLTIIINLYDIIQGNENLFNLIVELIGCFTEFLPLTGFENAQKVKDVVCIKMIALALT